MSAHTRKFISCDEPFCRAVLKGSFSHQGIKDVRASARHRGWTHPSGYTDYCPDHRGSK